MKISDEGLGISLEDISNVFDPFVRGENAGNVTGTSPGFVDR